MSKYPSAISQFFILAREGGKALGPAFMSALFLGRDITNTTTPQQHNRPQ